MGKLSSHFQSATAFHSSTSGRKRPPLWGPASGLPRSVQLLTYDVGG